MSFITKRERVFNEYDLFDLPARNEGKLKAYASCTDARAWSHFCSDKSEHLVEIIKRNNDKCRTKYVPTDVIVDTLMVAKNAEIGRLKRRIEEFEQMLAAYDQLELTCEQKCEIANAHAAIKAANKELDELYLDLDLSGFTEVKSDAFETGKSTGDEVIKENLFQGDKSRGDEWTFEKAPTTTMESKGIQMGLEHPCDASTSVTDPRIQEMQDTIISKDAKLNAMQNTIAVMENDVCEPYCIYAHIYTALEKIFGILCQNDKYKLYLNLMTDGKDISCVDIKGKILFKLKVLEKFCLALIAPCSQETNSTTQDCSCYRAEIAFALKSAESQQLSLDNKRAHLVADIMENEEMKEILSKENCPEKNDNEQVDYYFAIDDYNINTENLNRLKNLQENYNDLMACYESLKHERNFLQMRCQKYEELEIDYENLKAQLKEYNNLWNEKERYRKRSVDLDSLKEQYLTLSDETSNLETRLRAEKEINRIKADTIERLQAENITLEKKLNDSLIAFEKEKNTLQCKLKETECQVMCQEQQIKSLSVQVDRLLEQDQEKTHSHEVATHSLLLMDEIESLKDQIRNLKEALFCNEEEKQNLQLEFQEKLKTINELRIDIDDWKTTYEKMLQRNEYMKNDYEDEILRLKEENVMLSENVKLKDTETNNLINMISNKSEQIEKLMEENEYKNNKNKDLFKQLHEIQEMYDNHVQKIENEKKQAIESLTLAKQESQELLDKVKDYNEIINKEHEIKISLETQTKDYKEMQDILFNTIEENKSLQSDLREQKSNNSVLIQEIKRLREDNIDAVNNINALNSENNQYKTSLELTKKKSELLETNLRETTNILDNAMESIQLSKSENQDLKDELIKQKQKFANIQSSYDTLLTEKNMLQNDFNVKVQEYNNIHNNLKIKIEFLENNQKTVTDNIAVLQNENAHTTASLNALKKEKSLLAKKLKDNEELKNELEELKVALEEITKDKDELNKELQEKDIQLTELKKIKQENNNLHKESQHLLTHSEDLEKSLLNARNQLVEKSMTPQNLYKTVYKEIEEMKREKLLNHNRIRELLDKLDELENIISTLNEDISARDYKISILQNHINQLEEEIRQLHKNIAEAVDTGEQISSTSYEKIDQSLKIIETHHSRATHNMKMELAQLQNEKYILEEQLSASKLKTENSIHDKSKYLSQIRNLQNERDIIITDIKQLELKSVGDSALSPDKCDIEDVLMSLDRISKILDEKSSKSISLEQTLLKVQTSSQLLLSEAKEIVEKEKQKIINEKEEAIRDRINMEQKLDELKCQLEEQISSDKKIILDLEAKLLNQKLITDKINKSTQNYISKLEEEIQSLQDLYQNSLAKLNELQEKVQHLSEDKITNLEKIDKIYSELKQKCKDISELQKTLEMIKNKQNISVEIQTSLTNIQRSISSETDSDLQKIDYNNSLHASEFYSRNINTNKTLINHSDKIDDNNISSIILEKKPYLNEVQILAANIEPSYDFIRNSYLNYKIQQLSIGHLEQYSFSNEELSNQTNNVKNDYSLMNEKNVPKIYECPNFIDIYNKQSLYTNNSSKTLDDQTYNNSPQKSNAFTELDFTTDSFNTVGNSKKYKNSTITNSSSGKSTDKDLFIIYHDNGNNYDNSFYDNKKTWNNQSQQILVESVTVAPQIINKSKIGINKYQNQNPHTKEKYIYLKGEENDNDSVKPKLRINLPFIDIDNPTMSDNDKKSLDSYKVALYSTPKQVISLDSNVNENINKPTQDILSVPTTSNESHDDSNCSLEISLHKIKDSTDKNNKMANAYNHLLSKESHYKLSRVGADVLLIKSNIDNKDSVDYKNNYSLKNSPRQSLENFGLQYILHKVKQEINSEHNIQTTLKIIRKSKSDEGFNQLKSREISESSPLKLSPLKLSSIEYKITSNLSTSKSSNGSKTKSFVERSVMAKVGDSENYESKIQSLTKTLDNIEKDYKKKIEVIKIHYDSNIKNIINKHNQGVKSIQNLHEETLQDIITRHENEVESLRTFSIEALRKSDKLEKEIQKLKTKIQDSCYDTEPIKITPHNNKKRRRSRIDTKTLTKTNVEALNVRPKSRFHGPCTCSLDINISDTIRNIFDQVDVEQRKMAEHSYMKYIANKILNNTIEALDTQELSFLHLKVCRTWKMKLNKEEALQKRIDSLENELLNKQRFAQQHIAELDRKVAEERRQLQKVREAVCRPDISPVQDAQNTPLPLPPPPLPTAAEKDLMCKCNTASCSVEQANRCSNAGTSNLEVIERRSAGDLVKGPLNCSLRPKRTKIDSNRAIVTKLDADGRCEKKFYSDEMPTRLRRPHASHGADRQTLQRTCKRNTRT
ncbi:repetitive organellar protein-like [Galleria mellonella]|uniref:Repetitive organellar protein-like n=1 Tax=Galleria mellonella TaxID=7137 RepID=A0ABM3N2S2_GALME|nr:repetitive organellar protein-like [Galleria mellonella]